MEFYIIRTRDKITVTFSKKKITGDQTLLASINFEKPNGCGDAAFWLALAEMLKKPEFTMDWEKQDHQTITGAAFALVIRAFEAGVDVGRGYTMAASL